MSKYAPEYTKKERLFLLAKHMAWAIPLVLLTQFYFFPWFENYAEQAHCYAYGDLTGVHLVFYFVFVALPIGSALVLLAIEGPRAIKVLRLGQNPLPHEKVLRKTKYTYGRRAKVKPIIFLLLIVFMLALGVQGIYWANEMIGSPPGNMPNCS